MSATKLCLLFLLTHVAVPAQETGTPATQPPSRTVITASFPGGTLAEFAAMLREIQPQANILVSAAVAASTLPAIELRGATLDVVLRAACEATDGDYMVQLVECKDGVNQPVYTLRAGAMNALHKPAAAQTRNDATAVFSLNRLTDGHDDRGGNVGFKAETILSAIEAACSGARPPVLRYHRDSGLLIVTGSLEQQALVRDVLSCLEQDNQRRSQQGRPNDAGRPAAKGAEGGGEPKKNN